LIENIGKYDPNVNKEYIKKAYIFALKYHGTQLRDSGEPYFSHPLEVASILIELKMDAETVVAGLLHDTIEDTKATLEDVQEEFGQEVANMVDGVTKLSELEMSSDSKKQIENFKKLLISSASDVRVLVIKLVDRLHNIRTLQFRPIYKRQRTAEETLEVYAPLAARLGMIVVKEELQDTSFFELYPEVYNSIHSRLKDLYEKSVPVIEIIVSKFSEIAEDIGIKNPIITGRMKSPYSIWEKINRRNISFEQLADIMAFRNILETVDDCYKMLGAIHKGYKVIPGGFRDYISAPKSNGYQSLHTSVIGPFNRRIEIQIRTPNMHQIAEYGIAAHWNYKQSNGYQTEWLSDLANTLENSSEIEDFFKTSKTEMVSEKIFCVTPSGRIVQIPNGSSIIDFAYEAHPGLGNCVVKAMVNGREVPLKTKLCNGDAVQIVTDPHARPSEDWKNYAFTLKAKLEIQKKLRDLSSKESENTSKGEQQTITYSSCCMPVLGDRAVSLINVQNNRAYIHIENCQALNNKILSENEKIVIFKWGKNANKLKYITKFLITMKYTSGCISKIVAVVEQMEAEIISCKTEEKVEEFATICIELKVQDIEHLMELKTVIRNHNFVINIERILNCCAA
jgi:GTP pyrophosphokinase